MRRWRACQGSDICPYLNLVVYDSNSKSGMRDLNIIYKELSPPRRMQGGKFISIEGNIGSGKSTILKIIRENFPELTILDEPLTSWEKVGSKQNINLLQMYYTDPKRWGFTFQIYAFMTRLKKWTQFSQLDKDIVNVKVSERSLLSDRYVFASIMRDMDILNEAEHEIYLHCYRDLTTMNKIAKVRGIIYVQCDPHTCSARIQKRAREGEGSIPLDYLEKLHSKHEEWLNPPPCSPQTQSSNNSQNQQVDSYEEKPVEQTSETEEEEGLGIRYLFQEEEHIEESAEKEEVEMQKQENYYTQSELKFQTETNQSSTLTLMQNSLNPQNSESISINNEKVLIIDNTQPIDKSRIIGQIRKWLLGVF